MSAQGGTLRAPVHFPMGLIIAAVITFALAVSIVLIAGRLGDEPAGTTAGVAQIDWSAQLGHPRVGDHGQSNAEAESRMPEQRVYPDGFSPRMPEQRVYPDGFGPRMPEQRVYPDGI